MNSGITSSDTKVVSVYVDYKSPYAFVAKNPIYRIEEDFSVELDWLPYTLDIADYLGSMEGRTPHQWRRVRYSYMDARRIANKQGLVLKGPQRVYSAYYSSAGMLYAKQEGFFRRYNDLVFDKFWRRELDLDDIAAITAVIETCGGNGTQYRVYAEGEGRQAHARIRAEAEALGIFGVPMFVFKGELFWGGDRIPELRERLQQAGLSRNA